MVGDGTLPTDPIPLSREEARLRLVCAALTGLSQLISSGTEYEAWARDAIGVADAALALLYPEPEEKG